MRGTVKRIQPISWLDNYTPVAEGWEWSSKSDLI